MGASKSKARLPGGSLAVGTASIRVAFENVEEDVAKFIVENPAVKDALVKAVSSAMKAKADGADENPVAHIASHLTATAKKSQPADKTRVSRLLSTEPSFPKGRAHKGAACRGLQLLTTDAQMDDIFDKLVGDGDDGGTPAGNEALLTYTKFVQAMHTNLITNLTEPEIERIWCRVIAFRDGHKKKSLGTRKEVLEQRLSKSEFLLALRDSAFLRNVAVHLSEGSGFNPSADYDYTKSTNENYAVTDVTDGGDGGGMGGVGGSTPSFYGPFADIRSRLDYTYHVHYTEARQKWQDWAIETVVARTSPQSHPWVVYTCGPMGAGKGYTLSWMSRHGYFPIEDIVCIDPDHFKKMMPEWGGYVSERAESAGSQCHRESGFLQEVAQEVAMRRSQNVWVDGSLRDGEWYVHVFRDLHRRFPHYKIAIFEVGASEPIVRERIAARALETGRDVPEHLIKASLAAIATSLDLLTPLVDFVARIDNNGAVPALRAFIQVNKDGDWGNIKARFAQPEAAGTFPCAMAPLSLSPLDITALVVGVERGDAGESLLLNVEHESLDGLIEALSEAKLALSPRCPVTLEGDALKLAGIPEQARMFSFAHAAKLDRARISHASLSSGRKGLSSEHGHQLVLNGGFVYFDVNDNICWCNVVDHYVGDESALSNSMLQFSSPLPLPTSTQHALKASGRLKPVTLSSLVSKGAFAMAWINPGEVLEGMARPCKGGAFAYAFAKGSRALQDAIRDTDEDAFGEYFAGLGEDEHEGAFYPVVAD